MKGATKELKKSFGQYGPMLFALGLGISIVAALLAPLSFELKALVALLGLVVGLFNISDKEVPGFLLASLTFMVSFLALGQVFNSLPVLNTLMPAFFDYMKSFTATAAGVVAFKEIYLLAKD